MTDETTSDGGEAVEQNTPAEETTANKIFDGGKPSSTPEVDEGEKPETPDDDQKAAQSADDDKSSDDDDGKDGKDGDDDGVPQYEDFTFPEGFNVDDESLSGFKEVAGKLGLDQTQAQELINLQTAFAQKQADQTQEWWTKTINGWVDEVKADKEIGGERFKETVAMGNKALDALGDDDLKKALSTYGVGSHPAFVKFFAKVGKLLSEDTFEQGGKNVAPPARSRADRIFSGPSSN